MNISFAWTTDALLARRKRCTRRDWSREYAARFPAGSIHNAYNRNARVGGKKVGNVRITRDPYPQRSCDIPEEDFENEGFAYMEENGLLIQGIAPRQFFDNWRSHKDVLFVVRFDLVFPCDRCGKWTTMAKLGPGEETMRLCALCRDDWHYYATGRSDEATKSEESWRNVYKEFCLTERG